MEMETKQFGGRIVETKQIERNGVPVGQITGYIATWDLDRGDDRFVKGAFLESLNEHRAKNRQIRFKDHHGRTVGGFPIDTVMEDDRGLKGTAEVNLEVQQGREAFSLAKQGVLSDFSIGFSAIDFNYDGEIRVITKSRVWEGSIVDEPMNEKANILEVKSAIPYQDLPLAPEDRAWDSEAAAGRVRTFTDSTEAPSAAYRRAFLWFDSADAENFGAYKLPIADVINGRLTAVPRGLFAAAAALQGARGGVDIPDADRRRVITHLERYYKKMDRDSPFSEERALYTVTEIKAMSLRDIEGALKELGLSKAGARALIAKIAEEKLAEQKLSEIFNELKGIKI